MSTGDTRGPAGGAPRDSQPEPADANGAEPRPAPTPVPARVREVFLRAVELAPSKRKTFLSGLADAEPDVLREVASLLEHHRPETLLDVRPAAPRPGHAARDGDSRPRIARAPRRSERRLLSRRVAVTALVLVLLGVFVVQPYRSVRDGLREQLEQDLVTVVEISRNALEHWIAVERAELARWAETEDLGRSAEVLARLARPEAGPAGELPNRLRAAPELAEVIHVLEPFADEDAEQDWALLDPAGRILAARDVENALGLSVRPETLNVLDDVFRGKTLFAPPFAAGSELSEAARVQIEESGDSRPVVAVLAPVRGAPVRDADGNPQPGPVVAALVRRQPPTGAFTDILEIARRGASGETYAVGADGRLLSESRFLEELRAAKLVPEDAESSALQLRVQDPGGNLLAGYRPASPPGTWRPTVMARSLAEGQDGVDVLGYRDYRGVQVVGAWRWLPEYGFGIATELDLDEALAPLAALERSFLVVVGLLAVLGVVLLASTLSIQRLSESVDEARALGQYTLEELIGEGGVGQVWRASHAMLRRPCAVKVIKRHKVDEKSIKRFEREVQLTSLLTNPNTIAIYDYGRTPDGRFYYAMEYLKGLTLARLVQQDGPVPPARVAHILRKVASSLREAHARGIVHRDVKPLNIMLCRRGGEPDVVKVLDFGLVKDIEATDGTALTSPDLIAGTPQYLAPERLNAPDQVDGRADLYALGCVGYNLLTGKDVYKGRTSMEVCTQVLHKPTPRSSENASQDVPAVLDDLIYELMSKEPGRRPRDAEEVIENLDEIDLAAGWTENEANAWWDRYEAREAGRAPLEAARGTGGAVASSELAS